MLNVLIAARISTFSMFLGGSVRSFTDLDGLTGRVPNRIVKQLGAIDFGRWRSLAAAECRSSSPCATVGRYVGSEQAMYNSSDAYYQALFGSTPRLE